MPIYPEGTEPGGGDSKDELLKKLTSYFISTFSAPDGFSVTGGSNTVESGDSPRRLMQKILGAAQGGSLFATSAAPTFTGVTTLATYTVGTVPAVGAGGGTIYVSDATGASLTGSQCFSNGTVWIDVTTGAAVA